MTPSSAQSLCALLVALSLRSAALICLAALAACLMSRAPAAVRHAVSASCLAAVLLLPALSALLPPLRVGVSLPTHLFATRKSVAGAVDEAVAQPSPDALPSVAQAPPVAANSAERPAPMRQSVHSRTFNWEMAIVCIWIVGVGLGFLRLGLALSILLRLDRRSAACELDCTPFGLGDPPGRVRLADVAVPMTFGLSRPVILLPIGASLWPRGCMIAAIQHETAHILRRDWIVHLAARVACAVYWFHPLVWLLASRINAESEMAADDYVITEGRIDAPVYAGHLIDIARQARLTVPEATVAMMRSPKIEARLRAILAGEAVRSKVGPLRMAGIFVCVAVVALALTAIQFQRVALGAVEAPADSYRIGGFPHSASVEIAGVTEIGSPTTASSSWWDGAGKPISAAPFKWPSSPRTALAAKPGMRMVGFAVLVSTPQRQYADLNWQVLAPGVSAPLKAYAVWAADRPYENSLKLRYAITALVPASARTCTLQVDVADDSFHDLRVWYIGLDKAGAVQAFGSPSEGSYAPLYLQATHTGFSAFLSTPKPIDQPVSWIVVDRTGRQIRPSMMATATALTVRGIGPKHYRNVAMAAFPVPLSKLASIRLQTQSHPWREITNVSVWPQGAAPGPSRVGNMP